jgi:hypothetical protein
VYLGKERESKGEAKKKGKKVHGLLSFSIKIKAENRFKGIENWVILTYVF